MKGEQGSNECNILKLPLILRPCFSVRMAITEVKKEPIEYEETMLNTLNKIPLNKVSMLICVKFRLTLIRFKQFADKNISTNNCSACTGGPVHVPGMWERDC